MKRERRLRSLVGQLLPKACAAAPAAQEPATDPQAADPEALQADPYRAPFPRFPQEIRPEATEFEIFGPDVGLFSRAFTDAPDPLSEARLKQLFGPEASMEPVAPTGLGRRFHMIDASKPWSPEQAAFMVDALSMFSMILFADQDLGKVSLAHYERLANHFGAVQPNYAKQNYSGKYHDMNKMPIEEMYKKIDQINSHLAVISPPGEKPPEHLPNGSPALITITNVEPVNPKTGMVKMLGGKPAGVPDAEYPASDKVRCLLVWHTDQDHERISCSTTMFLVHKTPQARDPETGTWIRPDEWEARSQHSYSSWYSKGYATPGTPCPPGVAHFNDPVDPELVRRRKELPLNGETAFVDAVAAFEALPREEQEKLEKLKCVKFKQIGDDVLGKGYYCPLVRTNPRSGRKALYSPCYGSRVVISNVPPAEIEGMTKAEAKALIDKIELHCLQPQFRYDHLHREGDLVIWDDYATLHCAPPMKIGIEKLDDARLYYRISTKGGPSIALPRQDTEEWLVDNFTSDYRTPPEVINLK